MSKKRTERIWWLLAVVALVAAVGAGMYAAHLFGHGPGGDGETRQHVEPSSSSNGTDVDYTKASQALHAAIDSGLRQAGYVVTDEQETDKVAARQSVDGQIRWHARQLVLKVPAGVSMESVQQYLGAAARSASGEILATRTETYQGVPATRVDIGIKDKLGDAPLTLITDKIYVVTAKETDKALPKPADQGKGRLAIIIDDFGYNSGPISAFAAIDRPLTFSVLPYHSYSHEAASRALSSGHQVILHLPLEPVAVSQESETITVGSGMSDEQIQTTVTKAIQAVPGVIGANNHQGSRATTDPRVMRQVLNVMKANHMFFIDSRTNAHTVVGEVGRQLGVPVAANGMFIDNVDEVAAIEKELRQAKAIALRNGSAIVIGHARMTTAAAVREMIPELEADGVRLVFASQLIE